MVLDDAALVSRGENSVPMAPVAIPVEKLILPLPLAVRCPVDAVSERCAVVPLRLWHCSLLI